MVKIQLFARYREKLGFECIELEIPSDKALGTILKHPIFAQLPNNALFAINKTFVGRNACLKHGDQIAIMPPVSGG